MDEIHGMDSSRGQGFPEKHQNPPPPKKKKKNQQIPGPTTYAEKTPSRENAQKMALFFKSAFVFKKSFRSAMPH